MTTPHTAAEILRLARAKIDTPEKWTKGCMGRNADGNPLTSFQLENAVCLCSVGAIRAAGGYGWREIEIFESVIPRKFSIGYWNDIPGRTHAEVLAAFDLAIQLADQGRHGE